MTTLEVLFQKDWVEVEHSKMYHKMNCVYISKSFWDVSRSTDGICHYSVLGPKCPTLYQSMLHVMARKNINLR